MLMDSFEVENFRSLKHLKLEKLARVNLLVGKNNSGKTSVLEALFALRGFGSAGWLSIIENERGLAGGKSDFRYLFYRFDAAKPIRLAVTHCESDSDTLSPSSSLDVTLELKGQSTFKERELSSRETMRGDSRRSNSAALRVTLRSPMASEPIVFEIGLWDGSSEYYCMPVSDAAEEMLKQGLPFPAVSRYGGSEILTTNIDYQTLSAKLESLKFNKLDASLIKAMQRIDSRIQTIELGVGGQIYLDLGDNFRTLLPLNLMGEGIQRLMDVTSAIVIGKGNVVFIDEIDNGLHYSALRILWKGILQAAREYDVQVFATTHSAEALRHLTWVLDDEENASYRDDVAAYTLVRADDDTVRSYRHDYEQLDYALDHGLEVRN